MITTSEPEMQLAAWLFAKYLLDPQVQAEIVRSLFTVPVRSSSRSFLSDFESTYPQWGQAVDMVDTADFVPISNQWSIAQWLLQDAIVRLFNAEASEQGEILEQLDAMILEMSGVNP
jgi:ABC-type glycerol-3-phosphate transport system substrate-binding protein